MARLGERLPPQLPALPEQASPGAGLTPDTLEAAARTLGIDGSTLYRKRKAYGL